MDFLPKELENIIMDYKESIEKEDQRILDLLNKYIDTKAIADTIRTTAFIATRDARTAARIANATATLAYTASNAVADTRNAYYVAYATTDKARDAAHLTK